VRKGEHFPGFTRRTSVGAFSAHSAQTTSASVNPQGTRQPSQPERSEAALGENLPCRCAGNGGIIAAKNRDRGAPNFGLRRSYLDPPLQMLCCCVARYPMRRPTLRPHCTSEASQLIVTPTRYRVLTCHINGFSTNGLLLASAEVATPLAAYDSLSLMPIRALGPSCAIALSDSLAQFVQPLPITSLTSFLSVRCVPAS
jgi:hypothetical protein